MLPFSVFYYTYDKDANYHNCWKQEMFPFMLEKLLFHDYLLN